MKRRAFLSGLAASITIATPVFADDVVSSIVRQLKRMGFKGIVQERTLLGRVRITAIRKDGRREIIVNPKTGEILRDLWTPNSGRSGDVTIIDDRSGGSESDDDDGDDDDGSDEGNGGHGGGDDDGGDDSDDDGDDGGDDGGGDDDGDDD